jgi:hypothetical protein
MTSTSIHFHHKVSGYFDYWYVCIPVLHYRSAWCRSGLISDHRHSRERHQVYKVRIIVNSRLHSLLATSRDWTHKSVQFVPLLFLLYSEAHRLAQSYNFCLSLSFFATTKCNILRSTIFLKNALQTVSSWATHSLTSSYPYSLSRVIFSRS